MKRLAQRDADVANPILRIPEGMYSMLYVVLEGTSDAADDISLDELGRVSASYNGRNFVSNCLAKNIMHFGNLFGGRVDSRTPVAAATAVIVPIYCHEPVSPGNVLHVTDDDNAVIELAWGTGFTDDLASGTVSLYGDVADGIMEYIFEYQEYQFPLAAAGTIHERIPGENFTHVMITECNDADMESIEIELDGKTLHRCTPTAGIFGSNFRNRIGDFGDAATANYVQLDDGAEVTGIEIAEFPVYNGQWSEALSDDLTVIITASGALTTPSVLVTSLDFHPDKAARSEAILRQKIQVALERKRHLGKSRPVTAYQANLRRAATAGPTISAR